MYPVLAPGTVNRILTTADLNLPDADTGPSALDAAVVTVKGAGAPQSRRLP
jgi:hypothetical protein